MSLERCHLLFIYADVDNTIILCLFIHNSRSKHSRETTSNFAQFSKTLVNTLLFSILTVGSISLGNCRFSCLRRFQQE